MVHKVVVTGIGATTPLGGDSKSTWQALLAGESGITTLTQDWVAKYELPVTFAGQAKVPAKEMLTPQEAKRLDPSSQLALVSAREAWLDAGSPEVAPERLAVEYATGIGGIWTLLDAYDTLKERGPRRVLPMTVPMLMANGPAAAIGMELHARAGVRTACRHVHLEPRLSLTLSTESETVKQILLSPVVPKPPFTRFQLQPLLQCTRYQRETTTLPELLDRMTPLAMVS